MTPSSTSPAPAAGGGDPRDEEGRRRGVSRRGLFAAAGVTGAVGVTGAALGIGATSWPLGARAEKSGDTAAPADVVVPFRGEHQAGITTPAQDRLHMAAFDLVTDSRADLILLLKEWTRAAEEMTRGNKLGEGTDSYLAPPSDTGEAMGLSAANLTITIGFGRSLFEKPFLKIKDKMPAALEPLPHFPNDKLDPARSDGDIIVQACADDPQVAVHAIRNLARIGFSTVSMRWSQLGFGRTSSTSRAQATPRNLFGFKDGTANLTSEDAAGVDEHVWVPEGADPKAAWMTGGTYLVARRIRMRIEIWDRTSLQEQEASIGRTKTEGAPLSGGEEFTEPDFSAKGSRGELIAKDSHVRLAHPSTNEGVKMLRRGYNYTDGSDELGRLDAGLFFIAFVVDPRTHFTPMQNRLSAGDRLHVEYLQHVASGLYAIPPGAREGEYIGQGLFGA
ncbi:iron uptake transporter deferrochelatase/peroxidase subunit [Falsarthrobacter nasiphocae]|uniref:Deferrochelatase n=1 Tax=Falsarthrobacter nasiphocae TaxID=189863 RepID=A0AAE3YGU6_9MICC|nr:iron uptake transporter deferrochelatase/peroxidase subunit [Falsarthrobacter nasiphocae]MDR6892472.1 deferrochelatase/peroxidase EfeB [Falsarthrobacter nasiphocae]